MEVVLAALTEAPFKPTCRLKYLTWTTSFLLAIMSGCRASEMHALCYKTPYLQFSNAGVTLFMRLRFLPKIYTKSNVSWPIFKPAMHNLTDVALHKLCVHRALREYMRCISDFRHDGTAQFFVAYVDKSRASPSPSKGSPNGWPSVASLLMTRMTSPHLMELRSTRPANWQCHIC